MNKEGLTEKEFLEHYNPGNYEKPSVTVDMLLFTISDIRKPKLRILLIKRGNHPDMNCWALPGGFVEMKESLEEAAQRELKEETGLENIYLEQLHTFGNPERDPRMRVITSAYMALIPEGKINPIAGDDASDVAWFNVNIEYGANDKFIVFSNEDVGINISYKIKEKMVKNGITNSIITEMELLKKSDTRLAFDHVNIINMALNRIIEKSEYTPIIVNLMPEEFTMEQLQSVYEIFHIKTPDFIKDAKMVLI